MRSDPILTYLLILTFSTGVIDALSVLALGHVFTANMTGNVVFMGFALAGWEQYSLVSCGVAMLGFFAGALAGGSLGRGLGEGERASLVARGAWAELVFQGPVVVMLWQRKELEGGGAQVGMLLLLGAAMGVRNAVARKLAVPDLTTTVLTLTVTGLAADSSWAGGENPRMSRRLLAVATMFAGAAVGAAGIRVGQGVVVLLFSMVLAFVAARVVVGTLAGSAPSK